MISIFKNIIAFLTNPKNTRMLLFAGMVILCLLLVRQCNQTAAAKEQVKIEQRETQRVKNNFAASQDTLETIRLENGTIRGSIKGYELSLDELQENYEDLLGDFEVEKNKPPITIIKTVTEIEEILVEVPVFISEDSTGVKNFTFNDTAIFDGGNSRTLIGKIPFEVYYHEKGDSSIVHSDSISVYANVQPGRGSFELKQQITLTTGLFKDKETGEIMIKVDTKYPGMTFTEISGANIMADPASKKITRAFRKTNGIGLHIGYGMSFDPKTGTVVMGPNLSIGLNFTPKFLQWGK